MQVSNNWTALVDQVLFDDVDMWDATPAPAKKILPDKQTDTPGQRMQKAVEYNNRGYEAAQKGSTTGLSPSSPQHCDWFRSIPKH